MPSAVVRCGWTDNIVAFMLALIQPADITLASIILSFACVPNVDFAEEGNSLGEYRGKTNVDSLFLSNGSIVCPIVVIKLHSPGCRIRGSDALNVARKESPSEPK